MSHAPPDGSAHHQPRDLSPTKQQQDTSTASLLGQEDTNPVDSLSPSPPAISSSSAAPSGTAKAARPKGHHRGDSFGSIASTTSSGSSSSDDGIAWDSSAYDSYQDDDSDLDSDDDDDDDEDLTDQDPLTAQDEDEDYEDDYIGDDDTRHLLMSSDRVSGVRSGLRVGETGTGTTIGLDLEDEEGQLHRRRSTSSRSFDGGEYDEGMALERMLRRGRRRDHQHDAETGQAGGRLLEDQEERFRDDNRGISAGKKTGKKSKRKKKFKKHAGGAGSHPLEGRMIREAVVGAGALRIEQEQRIAKRQMRVRTLWNIFYICAWYGCSTSLSFYNKWLFSGTHYNFRFPLFTTCLHMVAQFTLSSLTLFVIPSLRPKKAPSPKDLGTKIMPCAVASGLDIGLSNSSLKTITLAFYTMCKSSSLAFVLVFAFLFKLEKPTWRLALVIGVISVGLFMMVMSEVDFVLVGFIQVMLASFFGGLRWALTQLLLEKSEANKQGSLANPISTIFFLSPIMGVCLLVLSAIVEGFGQIFSSEFFSSFMRGLGTLGLLLLGGVIAFLMVLAEFNLIARTSVVSLSVLGIVKEVVTIVISAMVFHDHLTVVNIMGLFVTLAGIGFYHFMKLREMRIKTQRLARQAAEEELAKVARMRQQAQLEGQRRRTSQKLKKQQQRKQQQQQGQELKQGQEQVLQYGSDIETKSSSLLVDTQMPSTSSLLIHSPQSPGVAKSPKSVRFQQEPFIIHDVGEEDNDSNVDNDHAEKKDGRENLVANVLANGGVHNPFEDPAPTLDGPGIHLDTIPPRTSS